MRGDDYSSPGFYFVTVSTQDRACILGEVVGDTVLLRAAGRAAAEIWQELPTRFSMLALDAFVVMPNHMHGIIQIGSPYDEGAQQAAPLRGAPALPEIMRAYKSISAIAINRLLNQNGSRVWQRNYYEHVIRGEVELRNVREYVQQNPRRWALDRENPAAVLVSYAETPWRAPGPENAGR